MDILTIGHGNHSIESFIDLLRQQQVEIVVDTRSKPFSARYPQFSKRVLAKLLDEVGVTYLFLGDKLGGRPNDPALYDGSGKPDYGKISKTAAYKQGINALLDLARGDETVAIMCSESDYMECHRHKLIAKSLDLLGVGVQHILKDGSLKENPAHQMTLSI